MTRQSNPARERSQGEGALPGRLAGRKGTSVRRRPLQVADDILDVTASSEDLGKTAGKDEEVAKTTYPKLLGLDASKVRRRYCATAHLLWQRPCAESTCSASFRPRLDPWPWPVASARVALARVAYLPWPVPQALKRHHTPSLSGLGSGHQRPILSSYHGTPLPSVRANNSACRCC